MGPKICPSGPFIVNKGSMAQIMIMVENNKLRCTSCEARMIRSRRGISEFSPELKRRKIFSTMMTDESTMMPKSTAPIDNRLALLPRTYSTQKANSKANGMLSATISALRTLFRNSSRMPVTRTMPINKFSWTVSVVTSISFERL